MAHFWISLKYFVISDEHIISDSRRNVGGSSILIYIYVVVKLIYEFP